jgi:hypothetical protein
MRSYVLSALAVVAVWGCSDSTAPSNSVSNAQASADVAASTAPAVSTSASAFLAAEGGTGAAGARVPGGVGAMAGCTVHSSSGLLTYSTESHPDSVSFNVTWEFFAGAGCQNTLDAASTDSIAFAAAEREVDNDPRFVASAMQNWTFGVLGVPTLAAATTHVWNGVGMGTDTATHATPGLDRTYIGAAYDTATNVVFPHPLNGVTVPASGTFSRWTTVTVTQTTKGVHKVRTVSLHVLVTFNGATQVPLVVFDDTGARLLACTADLTARRVVNNSCQ